VGRPFVALLALVAFVACACSSGSGSSGSGSSGAGDEDAVYPSGEWARTDAAAAGFDPAVLDEIAADAEAHASNCLVVVRGGRIVADWYWNDTDATTSQDVFSVTKSYASTLVGLAQEDGALDIDDRASEFIPSWAGTPSADVTIEDLLSNDSGRHWDLQTDSLGIVRAADRTGFAVGLGQDVAPGSAWVYSNSAIQTLDAVLSDALGEDPARYARRRVLAPIGMTDSEMTHDVAGNTTMFSGLQSTCEDMARYGYLFLQGGDWRGEQIVPSEWVNAATGQASQDIQGAYGYLWWLNRPGPIPNTQPAPAGEDFPIGQIVATAPADMYWALGLGGQIIQVDPGSDTVVVRLGPPVPGTEYNAANTARVVTEALVDP
jgi:CubicO group peptidase (beta-lactamase class C family)